MDAYGKPIKNVSLLHYGQTLSRVITRPISNDGEIQKVFSASGLNYAAIEKMQVLSIAPNESRTGLVISGNLVNKTGELLYPDDIKKNYKENIEIVFDQDNVVIQAGTWFEDEKVAQAYAKTINLKTRQTIDRINKAFETFKEELDDYIEHGV